MNYNTAGFFNGHSNVDYSDNFHHWYNHLENYENGDVPESSKSVMAADEGVEPEEDTYYDSWSNPEHYYNEAERNNEDARIEAGERWEDGYAKDPFRDWDKHSFYGSSRGDDFVGFPDFEAPTSTTGFDFENAHRGGGAGSRGKRRRARALCDEQRHPCRVCGKMLSTKWYAREHERSVHGTGDSYQCNICGERLKLAIYAVKHVQKEHPNCTEKPFGQYYKLVSDPIDSVFTCNLCGVETMQMCEIQRHLKELHSIDKRFNRHYSKKEKGGSKEYRGWSGRRLTRGRGRGRGRQRLRDSEDRLPESSAMMDHQTKLSSQTTEHQTKQTLPPILSHPPLPSSTHPPPATVFGLPLSLDSGILRTDDRMVNHNEGRVLPYPNILETLRLDHSHHCNHHLMSSNGTIHPDEHSRRRNEKHPLPPPLQNERTGTIHDLVPFVDISNPVAADSMMPYQTKSIHSSLNGAPHSHSQQPFKQDITTTPHPHMFLRGPHHLNHLHSPHIGPPTQPNNPPPHTISNQPQSLSPPDHDAAPPHSASLLHARPAPTPPDHQPPSPHSTSSCIPLSSHQLPLPTHSLLQPTPGHLIPLPSHMGKTQPHMAAHNSQSPDSGLKGTISHSSAHSTLHANPIPMPATSFPITHATSHENPPHPALQASPPIKPIAAYQPSSVATHLQTQGPPTPISAGITKISEVIPTFDTNMPFSRTSLVTKGTVGPTTLPDSNQAVLNPEALERQRPRDVVPSPHDYPHPLVMPSPSPLFKTAPTEAIKNEIFGSHFGESSIPGSSDLIGSSEDAHLNFPGSPSNINSNLKSFLETSDQF